MLGASAFLAWTLWSWQIPAEAVGSHGRIWRTIRAIAKIGLVFLPAAFFANALGYVSLGNFLGLIFLRSVYLASALYAAIRIIEALIVIALHVRPLSLLRVISLHRPMLQRRACRLLELARPTLWRGRFRPRFALLTSP
jgi:hypothetical protein